MSLTGDIRSFSLSAIGRLLHQEKKTGILSVHSGDRETKIYFRAGDIVFISGALAAELSLGALLKEKKLVTDAEIDLSLEIAKSENKRLGVVFLEKGFISQKKLVNILNYQFKEAISNVLTWRAGSFSYEDGIEGFVEDIRLKLDPIRLVAEAEKWKSYRSLIPNDRVIFHIKAGALKADRFSADGSLRVMLLIDGKRDVAKIIAESGLSRLAVYRALSALAAQDAIEVQGTAGAPGTGAGHDMAVIVGYYLEVIHAVTTDISLELGEKKAYGMLLNALENAPASHLLAGAVVPGDSPGENTGRVCERLVKSGSPVGTASLEAAFKAVIFHLLREKYHVLGFKAVRNTLLRLITSAERLQDETGSVAESVLPFFRTLAGDKGLFSGKKALSTGGGTTEAGADASKGAGQSLEKTGGAAIIAFYSRVIQMVTHEMETEIGGKVYALLNRIMENSEYYDRFLSQYRVDDGIQENVERIRGHIAREGHRLAKNSFVSGFQQVLIALLTEEQRLLGEKSARATVHKIEGFLANISEDTFRPLIMNLIPTLKRII
ncbi:MAG: DUF4388 domain-containing protein [Deltaproteobacteria bacterium]|nr:DUF4388 domain-containing protein [Deltaproteobacteria bacterium]